MFLCALIRLKNVIIAINPIKIKYVSSLNKNKPLKDRNTSNVYGADIKMAVVIVWMESRTNGIIKYKCFVFNLSHSHK